MQWPRNRWQALVEKQLLTLGGRVIGSSPFEVDLAAIDALPAGEREEELAGWRSSMLCSSGILSSGGGPTRASANTSSSMGCR
jgi:hypothetical protein